MSQNLVRYKLFEIFLFQFDRSYRIRFSFKRNTKWFILYSENIDGYLFILELREGEKLKQGIDQFCGFL